MEVSGQNRALVLGKERGVYWIGGFVGLRENLDTVKKIKISCPCPESNPNFLVSQPIIYSVF
jgi:hypothetical protein